MLDKDKLQSALKAVLTACTSENSAPSHKFAEQLTAADQLLAVDNKLFSCFGMDCCWHQKAS
jgi:hypothetical protein